MAIGLPIDLKATEIIGTIDPKADVSLKRVSNIYSAKQSKATDANSLQVHAKKDKGVWALVHDNVIVKTKGYLERGTIYDINIIESYPTEKDMEDRITELGLKEPNLEVG